MRWLGDDGHVSVFRFPSNNSNGNTFDFQGRQLSCEHLTRRVVRCEHDGTVSVIADNYQGKRLNSPNDIVVHPDGSIWFTDPPYGGQLYEGEPDAAGGASNPTGKFNPRIGQPAGFVPAKRELPTNCYRVDPSGRIDIVVTEEQIPDPNGILFSPDYKQLYVVSTGKGRATRGRAARATSTFSMSARTSCRTRGYSPTASWTACIRSTWARRALPQADRAPASPGDVTARWGRLMPATPPVSRRNSGSPIFHGSVAFASLGRVA